MKFIFSISLLIISAVLFFTLVNPLYGEITQLRGEVATYNIALSNSTDLRHTQDKLAQNYSNIPSADRDRLEHFLPNTANNIKFILEIERIAGLHGMPIKDIKFTSPTTDKASTTTPIAGTAIALSDRTASLPYGIFPIEFSTVGNYNNFVLFMHDLEHNLRLVDVKSVNFSIPAGDQKGVDPNLYSYDLKIETYWLK